jgi:hypothetical protein
VPRSNRARNRDRTDDLILTKDVLYRLSYASVPDAGAARGKSVKVRELGVGLKGAGVAFCGIWRQGRCRSRYGSASLLRRASGRHTTEA